MIAKLAFFNFLLCTDIAIHGKKEITPEVPTSKIDTNLKFDNIPKDVLHDINIENIDINRLRMKVDEMFLTPESKTNPIETRRAPYFDFWSGLNPYYQAKTVRVRRRLVDNMVQLLYMARYSLREMQESPHYSTNDSNFRIAYTFRTGQKVMRNMHMAYKMALDKVDVWENMSYHIIIHSKIVRCHIDYVYAYWVGIKIDHAMKEHKLAQQRIWAAKQKKMGKDKLKPKKT